MGRYWRTLRRFWGTAVAVQLEYQANVLIELLAVAMSLAAACSCSRCSMALIKRWGAGAGPRP